MARPTSNSTLRLPPEVKALLRAHAHVRNVRVNDIIQDALRGWLAAITDWEHPYFSREVLGFGRITGVPNRYPGYVRSMGFVDATYDHQTPIDPSASNPMRYHADHYRPTPQTEADETFVVDAAELTALQRSRMNKPKGGYDNDHPGEDGDDAA